MPPPRPFRLSLHEPEGHFSERVRTPRWVINAVGTAIVVLSLVGAYRGLMSAQRGGISASLLDPSALVQGQPLAASPAVSLPADPNWSTLKGPQVLTPPVRRAVVADEPASDDAADMQDAAADSPEARAAEAQTSPPTSPQTNADDAAPIAEQRAPAEENPAAEPRRLDARGRISPPTP